MPSPRSGSNPAPLPSCSNEPRHPHAALDLAVVFAGLGDKENALHWLEKAQEMHVSDLIGIGQDSRFAEVRRDRRFQELLRRVGAPK